MKRLLALIILSTVIVGNASALELNVLGGLTMGAPNASGDPDVTYKSGTGITYGATLGFGMMPGFGIETGVLSVGKKFKSTDTGAEFELSNRTWEIPFLLRFTALPILSFGGGVYYQLANKITKVKTVATGVESEVRTSDFDQKRQDLGLKVNARGAFPIAPAISALLDVSYKMGLTDRDTTAAVTDKNSELDLLAGVSLGF